MPLWHDAWPNKDVKAMAAMLPDIEKHVAAVNKAELPMILRDKKAAWVAGVHGWIGAADPSEQSRWRAVIDDLVAREIANSLELMSLVDSGVEFMVTTDLGESPLVHGRNLKDLLARRIRLAPEVRDRGESVAPRVAAIAGHVLGWDHASDGVMAKSR